LNLHDRLTSWTGWAPVTEGARDAADLAEQEALSQVHALPGGGLISIEPTRALVAVDVDIAGRPGGDARRLARQVNLTAIAVAGPAFFWRPGRRRRWGPRSLRG